MEENGSGEEKALGNPEDNLQSSKRMLSPSASASDAFSPIPKRGRPSFRINSPLKGTQKKKNPNNIFSKVNNATGRL